MSVSVVKKNKPNRLTGLNQKVSGQPDVIWFFNVAIRERSTTGVQGRSKSSAKVIMTERGKPESLLILSYVKPQGARMGVQVEESGESKCYSVMG